MLIDIPQDGYYPSAEGVLIASGHLKLRLPRVNPAYKRPAMTVEVSWDGGETWEEYYTIGPGDWRRGNRPFFISSERRHRVRVTGLATGAQMWLGQTQ